MWRNNSVPHKRYIPSLTARIVRWCRSGTNRYLFFELHKAHKRFGSNKQMLQLLTPVTNIVVPGLQKFNHLTRK